MKRPGHDSTGLQNDVANLINACESCQSLQPSLPNDNEIKSSATYPMEKVAIDLFQHKNIHYLMMVDRYSGYLWIYHLRCLLRKQSLTNLIRGPRHSDIHTLY